MAEKKKTIDEQISRVEEIAKLMNDPNVSLDESLKLYEEGNKLISELKKKIEEAKAKVEESNKTLN